MITTTNLLLDILFQQVESVPDQPKRILFKGVSNLSEDFMSRVAVQELDWDVRVTSQDEDVVGARNNIDISTLVVFYRDEVRARESLNAFRQFNEAAVAQALVQYVTQSKILDEYYPSDVEKLNFLLGLVYPSVEQLATFLLAGKGKAGKALPHLGLFTDETLNYDLSLRQWQARLRDNHNAAVLRWRDFLEKGQRNRDARELLGSARRELLEQAETDPQAKIEILREVTLSEALGILNPPSQTVLRLMKLGLLRHEAESFVDNIKEGRIDPENPPTGTPTLPDDLVKLLKRYIPRDETDEDGEPEPDPEARRVNFCLEAILRLVGQQAPLPNRLGLARTDTEDDAVAYLLIGTDERLQVSLSPDIIRALAVPNEGASELRFRIFNPEINDKTQQNLFFFSLENLAGRVEGYEEFWPETPFWAEAVALYPEHATLLQDLAQQTQLLRDVIDPDWKPERETEEETEASDSREPNNPIYLIFDLVYLAHRDLFERYFDAWLKVATLPWRADVSSQWWQVVERILQLGLARSGEATAILPFHPLRLAWHLTIFQQIEQWLMQATLAYQPLRFEPGVLSAQLQAVDRPRVLFQKQQRLVEVSRAPFFSIFTSENKKQRTRTPLDRARLKLEQFGRMWPFSLARLHLTFQPGDAGQDVYRLLTQQADNQPEAAFRVRAIVDNTTMSTAFDRYLMTTTDQTTDLLTQEHYESMLPRVEYTKGQLEGEADDKDAVMAHAVLLIDAFREENYDFLPQPGQLKNKHWEQFRTLAKEIDPAALTSLKQVDLSATPYHTQQQQDGLRELVYVPLAGNHPEYLRLLYDSLVASVRRTAFIEGVYYEMVRWDAEALQRLHHQADWVILFDRTLDRAFFEKELAKEDVKLIDFYTNLRGGYRLSISSRRVEAVEWQLIQVLNQFFSPNELDLEQVAKEMLSSLAGFASGLLLKTLGGGSLTQELLGLYATYCALLDDKLYSPEQDFLVPLDNYQNWFGRRTQRGRRADLMIVRSRNPKWLELIAVESKWYKNLVDISFVNDEFGPNGQLRSAVQSLHSLFDPAQKRLDKEYWQRVLQSLLDEAPSTLRQTIHQNDWELKVDGLVYVHQYLSKDKDRLAKWADTLNTGVNTHLKVGDVAEHFWLGPAEKRLRLKSYPELVSLFHPGS